MDNRMPESTTGAAQDALRLFGLQISNTSMAQAVDWIVRRAQSQHPALLNFVNAHCLNVACRNPAYRRALEHSTRLLPDGSGVKLALRLKGERLIENLNGTDLFPPLCAAAQRTGLSLYLLGAAPGVAARVADTMQRRYPGLRIAGTQHGFFETADNAAVIADINRSGADILLVAMGVPRQELWLLQHQDQLQATVKMGVGGLFDFYSGRIPRAPQWLRRLGMEWTWRLLQEPARMWRRYLLGNPAFVLRALCHTFWTPGRRTQLDELRQSYLKASGRRLRWWLSKRATPFGRRALDIVGAGLVSLLAAPLMAAAALAIRLESPGPVFFHQDRVGLRGKTFRLWKFRSMYLDAEARKAELMNENQIAGGVLFKIKRDPRITRVGRILRRFSIDELPQLWNVLRGDMALVGPRPALPSEVAQYSIADRNRLLTRPGITCIWQVSGRSNIPFEGQVAMDLEYIHNAKLSTDLKLLLKTVPAVISGHGAY
jgi:exopolysaccharide biosynthesis WecB/TagA/CpsF family protein